MDKTLREMYDVLVVNRDYWMIDNDYSRKFAIIEDVVTFPEIQHPDNFPYAEAMARHMMRAHKRMFERSVVKN